MSYIADTWYIKPKHNITLEILQENTGSYAGQWFIFNAYNAPPLNHWGISRWLFLCSNGIGINGTNIPMMFFPTTQDAIDCCEKYGYDWKICP
mgnify:CR=1 FL=1